MNCVQSSSICLHGSLEVGKSQVCHSRMLPSHLISPFILCLYIFLLLGTVSFKKMLAYLVSCRLFIKERSSSYGPICICNYSVGDFFHWSCVQCKNCEGFLCNISSRVPEIVFAERGILMLSASACMIFGADGDIIISP